MITVLCILLACSVSLNLLQMVGSYFAGRQHEGDLMAERQRANKAEEQEVKTANEWAAKAEEARRDAERAKEISKIYAGRLSEAFGDIALVMNQDQYGDLMKLLASKLQLLQSEANARIQ